MTQIEIKEKINRDEFDGEKLINNCRLVIAALYVVVAILFAVLRKLEGLEPFPPYGFTANGVFLLYAIFLFFYLRAREKVDAYFKYICVIADMTIISASIWIGCTYPELDPPIQYLSIWALFYGVLILLGAFRYSVPCAIFSGIYAGVSYMMVVILNKNAIDLPYFVILDGKTVDLTFPFFNESFRAIAIVVTGAVTGMACKRHLKLFSNMIESQIAAAEASSKTMDQTRNMAKTIRKSTDEIFLSSKDILSTANNQAASIQEIEATINENTQIAGEISEKTSSVASIAGKMENDVIHGFSVLERNVEQLENIKSKNDGVISGIITLGNKIVKIRDIVKNINTITDQTKVIAFNAALEAASAGERGKRFSVVASEVNRLADDIASLTRQIREQVEEIQNSSSSLIISSEESADKINEGNNLIKELEDVFREIRSGAEITSNQAQTITVFTQKQEKSSEHINIAIADISKGLSNFIQSTKVASSSAEKLIAMIAELDAFLAKGISKDDNAE
jgi:methyl-accepting chemotaxis protein